jgi:TetR/AcrR family transcriptional regulator, ethionamide resistance regulator
LTRSLTRRPAVDREARREEFAAQLVTAVEELLRDGLSFSAMTVDQLVAKAGVSRSKFYVHFRDKHDLLHTWFVQVARELHAGSQRWWSSTGAEDRDALRVAIGEALSTYRPKIPLLAATFDAATLDDRIAEETQGLIDRTIASLAKHIRAGQSRGWIDPGVLPTETAAWIVWMAERGQAQMFQEITDREWERMVDSCTDIVWNMLYATAPGRVPP